MKSSDPLNRQRTVQLRLSCGFSYRNFIDLAMAYTTPETVAIKIPEDHECLYRKRSNVLECL